VAEFWNVSTRPKTSRGGMGLTVNETDNRVIQIERGFPLLYDDDIAYWKWRTLVVAHGVMANRCTMRASSLSCSPTASRTS
jgi:hypothetical protein